MNMFKQINGVKSLNSILSSFHKVVEDLQKLQVANRNRIMSNDERVAKIQAESDMLNDEAEQAAKVQENITKLLA